MTIVISGEAYPDHKKRPALGVPVLFLIHVDYH